MKKTFFYLLLTLFFGSCEILTQTDHPTLLFKLDGHKVSVPQLGFTGVLRAKEQTFYEVEDTINVFIDDTLKYNVYLQKDSTVFFSLGDNGNIAKQVVSRY